MGAHDLRCLRFVDESSCKLSGLIDPKRTIQELALFLAEDILRF